MKKIIGLGNCLVDVLVQLPNDEILESLGLPAGSMQLIDIKEKEKIDSCVGNMEKRMIPGGSAANTIKALGSAGVGAGFIGKIADDANGSFFAETLGGVGVKTFLARGKGAATGVANTFITPDGQRTFATYLGISGSLDTSDVRTEMLDGYDILYVEGYMVQNRRLVDFVMSEAKRRGMKVCLDLASYNVVEGNLEFFRHLLTEYVDIVFANEEESRAVTGKAPGTALLELGDMCETAVVKLGANGSSAKKGGEVVSVPACEVPLVVDTTGAGDYFAAGFLDAMIHGRDIEGCLLQGGRLSAKVIQVVGCPIFSQSVTDAIR